MGRSVELAATSGPMPEECEEHGAWSMEHSMEHAACKKHATWREIRGGEVSISARVVLVLVSRTSRQNNFKGFNQAFSGGDVPNVFNAASFLPS